MSGRLRLFVLSAALAACAGFPSVGSAQSQQFPMGDRQPFSIQDPQQSQLRERLAGAVQRVQAACREELRSFCSTVTPGEGRVLLCMQAHEDKLGQQCEMALFDVSRNIEQATRRVERVAEACWNDIQANCAGSASIGQCMMDKRASLSPQCQAVVAAHQPQQQPPRQQSSWAGLPIYSTDGTKLGEVTGVKMTPDGKVEAVQAEIGHTLGIGANSVLISADDLQVRDNRIELPMGADQVRAVLQGQKR